MIRKTALIGTLLLALAGAAACGRYGAPVRAQEYRDADKAKEKERLQEAEKSDQERNEPLPAAP